MVTVSLSPENSMLVPFTQPVARATWSAETLSMRSPIHFPAILSSGARLQPTARKSIVRARVLPKKSFVRARVAVMRTSDMGILLDAVS
jgi:hypothetical protein